MKRILNENAYEDESERQGYGFWLWLLLIIIVFNGAKAALGLVQNFKANDFLYTVYAALALFIALSATLSFFTRKRWTPLLFIFFLLLNLLHMLYFTLIYTFNSPEKIDYFSLVKVVTICVLPIPYLTRSVRVKKVFTS
ncbi:DUF2569 family protein [Pontibacter pamirensis]|uniref:DUF2569 family protein n=1 Tax=Pontibacter pamirensis TaxID=2562824 RepID=UPI001389773F|nr:DUF2569 family protein [Pontibacter pamirensis]